MRRAWPPGGDWLLLAVLPLLLHLPELLHVIDSDPRLLICGPILRAVPGLLPGQGGWIDPNTAFTAESLGHLAAQQWLGGQVPWWNPYVGVGAPLAAEMQPAALFLPFVLLMHFPDGALYTRIAMQAVAALGAYGLSRRLGLHRPACLAAGVLYGFSGTLVWFSHGPDRVAAFLPWLLWGIERCRDGRPAMFAGALAFSLYAGFPETAYLDGLLALAWAALRMVQARGRWLHLTLHVTFGGCAGLMLAAPGVLSFAEFLTVANVGSHAQGIGAAPLPPGAGALLLMPALFGPIAGYSHLAPATLPIVWGTGAGGYVGAPAVGLALLGIGGPRESALRWMLLGCVALILAKLFDVGVVTRLWLLMPLLQQVAIMRYVQPALSMAVVVLAACAMDEAPAPLPGRRLAAVVAALGLLAAAVASSWPMLVVLGSHAGPRWFAGCSVLWAAAVLIAVPLLADRRSTFAVLSLFGLIGADAMGMATLFTASAPRHVEQDGRLATFLRAQPGYGRVLSIGRSLGYNDGAWYGFAAINETMLPVPKNWSDYLRDGLGAATDPIVFPPLHWTLGDVPAHLDLWRELGVTSLIAEGNLAHADATALSSSPRMPWILPAGQLLAGTWPASFVGAPLHSVAVDVGTYVGHADGVLRLRVCSDAGCAEGHATLQGAPDNAPLDIALDRVLGPGAGPWRWQVSHEGGMQPVAIWLFPASGAQPAGGGPGPRFSRDVLWPGAPPRRIARFGGIEVVQIDGAPYFNAPSCVLRVASRVALATDCSRPATLVRRELFFPGWQARVNRTATALRASGLFQAIDLPAGRAEVRFSYAPLGIGWAWLTAGLALAALVGASIRQAAKGTYLGGDLPGF